MAFSASALSGVLNRAFSIGPVKIELQSFSCVSTDTSGTATANCLDSVDQAVLLGGGSIDQTSAVSISGSTATFAFADPATACTGYVAKNINGLVLFIGR